VLRDKDEWRRPWVDGVAGLPLGGLAATTDREEPGSTDVTSGPDAAVLSSSLDGAFDIVADVASSPTSTGYRPIQPPTSASGSAHLAPAAAAVATAPTRGRARSGFLGGLVGGLVGAVLMVGALAGLDVVELGTLGDRSGGSDGPAVEGPAGDTGSGTATTPPPLPDPGPGASVIPDVADRVLPTVVRINVSGTGSLTEANALGSGVIYRSDGYIITNHHVIEGASAVEVLLANGDRLEAEIIGSDQLNDLAVLKVARDGLPVIALRPDDERLRVGETVVAIGSPFGLDATVTSGIISALNRDLRVPGSPDVIPAVIQTDAAINPGNSGGALVDLQGRLVGINTAIMSRSGANQGVGFAVSVRQAVVSSDQLIAQGFVRYPLLGITGTDVTAQIAESFGLDNRRGAVVDSVQAGSGAEAAGMRTRDLILAVDGVPLRSMADLVAEVRRRTPGETVVFDVLRGDERLRLEVVLGERPRS
jgi:S1-C subfamily serine protease